VIICISTLANAQKLPNVQPSAGIYAPANVKIDGKATEWNNQFQAFNKSTSLYYTMANTTDNLVLAIQTTDKGAIEKIFTSKLTLTLTGKNGTITISTPTAPSANIRKAIRAPELISDSLLNALNKGITSNFKEITVTGIKAITDPKIPVYNEYGILLGARVDINKAYTCELVIPIKHLEPVFSDAGAFNYTITVNGMKMSMLTGFDKVPNVDILSQLTFDGVPALELIATTEASGTYTLAKK
jgi:hypothetical protein